MKLTEKQERFAAEVAAGKPYAEALRIAYPASLTWTDRSTWTKASELAKHVEVKRRIEELRKPAVEAAQYTVVEAMVETNKYLLEAAKDRAWGPVSTMLRHKGQLQGLLLQKVEVGGVGEFQKFNAQEKVAVMQALELELSKRKALSSGEVTDVPDKLEAGEE